MGPALILVPVPWVGAWDEPRAPNYANGALEGAGT